MVGAEARWLSHQIDIKLVTHRETQERIAKRLGISERTFTRRKRDGLWTYPQLRRLFLELRFTEKEINTAMKGANL